MGHQGARLVAYDGQIHKKGIHFGRTSAPEGLGTYTLVAGSSVRQGQFAAYANAAGEVNVSGGTGVIGMFRWGTAPLGYAVKVDVPIVLDGTAAVFVGRGNISNVAVRETADFGSAFVVTTDYTVDATAGTITRVALGSIGDGDTVYVTFTYALVDADYQFDGRSFRNNSNDFVTGHGSETQPNVAIMTDRMKVFSTEYDTNKAYGLTSNFKLYCSAAGIATSTSGTDFVGVVSQLPTADDPFLGMELHGNPVA
jgi:hypothetical protein